MTSRNRDLIVSLHTSAGLAFRGILDHAAKRLGVPAQAVLAAHGGALPRAPIFVAFVNTEGKVRRRPLCPSDTSYRVTVHAPTQKDGRRE